MSCTNILPRPFRLSLALVSLALLAPLVQAQSVTSFTLVNADTNTDIAPLEDGDELNLQTLPTRNLSVRAATQEVGSVRFALDADDTYQTESAAPYALSGDTNGDYNAWTPSTGPHTLTATPYDQSDAQGASGSPLTISFSVVDQADSDGSGDDNVACSSTLADGFALTGQRKKWHPLTLTFEGPCTSEAASPNPFLDYRLTVTFRHPASGATYVVPGFFAADGQAGETSADGGNKWRARFTPDRTGRWSFTASFRQGNDVAVSSKVSAGTPAAFDGADGSFQIDPTDKSGRDHRGKGLLRYVGRRYLQFDNGDLFLKGGADAPENLLAYTDFDGTYDDNGDFLHEWSPHRSDWRSGDPTWQDGKGKNLIGALNYLALEGMNAFSFLTMNVDGDGDDVWPWTAPDKERRYDVSKLAQWEVVFSHADRQGLFMHFKTQETENDQLLSGGRLGTERKLYYRELIARFAHHHALNWNLGEENTNTDAQRKAFVDYISRLDPYDHPIVVHTYPGDKDEVYAPLLGYEGFDGASLQLGGMRGGHEATLEWVRRSAEHGRPWVVAIDEPGDASRGVTCDGRSNNHWSARREALWANLMAGGAGVEWYFGYQTCQGDLDAEDWRSREQVWTYTRHALAFFEEHLPFAEMTARDELTAQPTDYVLAEEGKAYAIYLIPQGKTELELAEGNYQVRWYDPRTGGALQTGSVAQVSGPGTKSIGVPPKLRDWDWVALVTPADEMPAQGEAEITVQPDSLTFETVTAGTKKTLELTMSNPGKAQLEVNELTIAGEDAGAFDVPDGAGSFTLEPGEERALQVRFAPESAGPKQAALTIESNAVKQSVALSGQAERDAGQADSQGAFREQDGLLIMEAESGNAPNGWRLMPDAADGNHPGHSGATGGQYLQWNGGDHFNTPGEGLITYKLQINTPGTYRFRWRSRIALGDDPTEHNDTWLRFSDADNFYGKQGSNDLVYPKGSGQSPTAEGAGTDGWFKIYVSQANAWSWQARTSDNDPHDIYVTFDAPGVYTMELSGRSDGHAVDRIVLYHASRVSDSKATDLAQPESPRTEEADGNDDDGSGENAELSVTSFTLINAETDQVIGALKNGDTLTLATLPTKQLNVRATTQPAEVGSVVFTLNGETEQTENAAPYTLVGDTDGDYKTWTPEPGSYTLTATPYAETNAEGQAGQARTLSFSVMEEDSDNDGSNTCASTRTGVAAAKNIPLSFFDPPVETRKTATMDVDLDGVQQASLSVTASDIDRPAEAALFINGTKVAVPEGAVDPSGERQDERTGTTPVDLSLLQSGQNKITFAFAKDLNGSTSGYEITALKMTLTRCATNDAPTPRTAPPDAPQRFSLHGNYPNPFNPQTTIRYELPRAAPVRLTVFNALGREVAMLVNEQQAAGRQSVIFDAHGLPSGSYFYRLQAGDFAQARPMTLVK